MDGSLARFTGNAAALKPAAIQHRAASGRRGIGRTGARVSTGWPVMVAMRLKSLPVDRTVSPAFSAVVALPAPSR